jgi:hypothetical protein
VSKKAKKRRGRERLSTMAKKGSLLQSPLNAFPEVTLSSWRDERLPEVLWAALIAAQLPRDEYLEIFREISRSCAALKTGDWEGLGHSNLVKLETEDFLKLFSPLLNREKLDLLHPLRLFKQLPDAGHWGRLVPEWEMEKPDDYEKVAVAIGLTSWHQSEQATDIRWLRVLSMILGGKMHFPESMRRHADEIIEFPNVGDLREVRPSIRAAEQSFATYSVANDEPVSADWANAFWEQCKTDTDCLRFEPKRPRKLKLEDFFDNVIEVYREVEKHFFAQKSFDAVDARLDGVFGITLYSLNLLLNLIAGNSYRRVEGRLILRSVCECYITLAYLLKVDAAKTWQQYRAYGHGQAKLAYLKTIDLEKDDKPKYISEEDLQNLANEDKWDEFVDIDLGSWAKKNLRAMADEAGVLDVYDKYYSWSSGYVHGQWCSVRDTVFDQCLNPLHRLHRIPAIPRANMNDCAEDAAKILNRTLELLTKAYPPFRKRL